MTNSPCYKCSARFPVCHDSCVAYRDWKEQNRRVRTKEQEAADADAHTKKTIELNSKRAKTRKVVGQR